jgi:hypothetical protein
VRTTETTFPVTALGLLALDASVVEALRSADLNKLTPIEAMALLAALQRQLS